MSISIELFYLITFLYLIHYISKIKADGWIQYKKDYQEKGRYLFCKDKYGLALGENRDSTFVTIEFSKSSPCWDFEETLKKDFYQLVK